ncbi:DNA-binding transcriptional regulator, PucR family [Deinococcus reticulitermitis]|uniref:DNA-binding transcriptional regulator, PucR family n=1 Tax=Deinococcus reticulitermitis TaxID=856736 RepID=A0A1H6ZX34_9DEIO|nr:PucR family transcriptional regulator [Deinococcus reticulitermitis]SEJ53365.1 DNA-binding transcriptional regulator, PucR family [Deinococcus reticulitermitis]
MPASADLPSLLAAPELAGLLAELRRAAASAQPERTLTQLLADLTGGRAEIRASWGAVVAAAGEVEGESQTFRLQHGRRHVGQLRLWSGPDWHPLGPLAAEYALLARLQTAAAGAARRRVGERTLDALLSGQGDVGTLGEEPYALATAAFPREPGTGASARAAHAHALDVLAGAGEGYFAERGSRGLCSVQGDRALWLWPAGDPAREGQELFAALLASTGRALRLGVSARHQGPELGAALAEARQALAAVRGEQGVQVFQELDPLYALLSSGGLDTLRAQVLARLAALGDGGRTEATLRAYLAHRGTLAELAGKQHLHVNTLRYRLRRAEQVLGASLGDPALLARLYLAFEGG